MARIHLENVGLTFRITRHGPLTFRDWFLGKLAPRLSQPVREVRALRNINLDIRDGQRVGLIGPNGAGKTTLLKVLADIYAPTAGQRHVEGRISSLFNVLLGFETHATGWDNIKYRGYLQGETPRSIRRKMEAIAEFSELGEYLDTPVRYYSTGMQMRLGFSIATAIEPDILLVDESINAGDLAFQAKAKARIRNVMSSASIVVVTSHNMDFLKPICDRLIWLDHGQIRAEGRPCDVIRAYTAEFYRLQAARRAEEAQQEARRAA